MHGRQSRQRFALIARCALAALLVVAAPPPAARAQNGNTASIILDDPAVIGTFVRISMDTGDSLIATIIDIDGGDVVLQHDVLGEIRVPRTRIVGATRTVGTSDRDRRPPGAAQAAPPPEAPAVPAAKPEPAPGPEPKPAPEPAPEPDPSPEPVPEPEPEAVWTTRLQIGLNGSEGSVDRLNFLGDLGLTRTSDDGEFNLSTNYRINTTRGDRTAHRLSLNIRNDWNLNDPRWQIVGEASGLFDEFRDFDVRAAASASISYRFIDNDRTRLSARLGPSVSREFGGPDDEVVPELVAALSYRQRLTDRQTLTASAEVFPDLREIGEFRSAARGAWEIKLEGDLSLRFSIEHRYESMSGNAPNGEFDYAATLVFTF